MSYDFLLLPRDPQQSWRQVMEASERLAVEEGNRPLSPAARIRIERVADLLQAHDPQLERFTTERHIELTRVDDTGIQVSLFSGELAIAVAYWHTGSAARAVMQIAWSYLAILEGETGWDVYDGQLGRSLDRSSDFDEVTGLYADSTARLHGPPETLRRPDQSGWRDGRREANATAARKRTRRPEICWGRAGTQALN
jgi:hypothetical protein